MQHIQGLAGCQTRRILTLILLLWIVLIDLLSHHHLKDHLDLQDVLFVLHNGLLLQPGQPTEENDRLNLQTVLNLPLLVLCKPQA